jgi:hypothetical protein
MTPDELEIVITAIEQEGFDYCFAYYDDFSEIKDSKFHSLRRDYLEAREALNSYLGNPEDGSI